MKISEVKLNEYDWMSIFRGVNDYGGAALTRGSGYTAKGRLTQQIFIKDFMNGAVSGLESAIQSGLVNPDKSEVAVAQAGDFATPPPKMTQADVGDFDLKNKIAAQKAAQVQAAKDAEIANVSNTSKTTESKYNRLNALFEAIINEDGTESIESWLTKFFTRHMRNVDLTGREQAIQAKAKEVATAIKQNKNNIRSPNVIKAIQSMGNLGYSLSMSSGAPSSAPQATGSAAQATAQPAVKAPAQTTAQPATQVAQPAAQPAPAQVDNAALALKAMGYSDQDIKDRLSKVTATSDEERVRQAVQMGAPARSNKQPAKRKDKPKSRAKKINPEDLMRNVLFNMDSLKTLDPDRWMDLSKIIARQLDNNPPASSNVVRLPQRR